MTTAPRSVRDLAKEALSELAAILDCVEEPDLLDLRDRIARAPRVFFFASGRSLLSLRAVAVRLMHLGVSVHVAGETATPAIGEGDLLVVASARGGRAAQDAARVATDSGASTIAITSSRDSLPPRCVDATVVLPARTAVPTNQHAGSLFEQSLLVLGDAVCRSLQELWEVPSAELDRRHANL